MDILKKVYPNTYKSKLFDFYTEKGSVAVLDIETTGLSSLNNKIIIFGVLEITPEGLISTQYFAENRGEEKAVLKEIPKYLEGFDVIITFNGASFDLPFIKKRLEKHGFSLPEKDSFVHLDLYKVIKKQKELFQLNSYSQKSVEAYMGITREDTISGGESVQLYHAYEKSQNKAYKKTILLHNQEDIYHLSKMLSLYEKLDIHLSMFHTGFLVKKETVKCTVEKIKVHQHYAMVYGSIFGLDLDLYAFKDGYTLEASREKNSFTLKIFLDPIHNSAYVYEKNFDFDLSKFKIEELGCCVKLDHDINYYLLHYLIKQSLLENL